MKIEETNLSLSDMIEKSYTVFCPENEYGRTDDFYYTTKIEAEQAAEEFRNDLIAEDDDIGSRNRAAMLHLYVVEYDVQDRELYENPEDGNDISEARLIDINTWEFTENGWTLE